jgi:hypothetical protein
MDRFLQAPHHEQNKESMFHAFLTSAVYVSSNYFTTADKAYDIHHTGGWTGLHTHLSLMAKGKMIPLPAIKPKSASLQPIILLIDLT